MTVGSLLLLAAVSGAPAGAAPRSPQDELVSAVKLLENFEDERAAASFKALLRRSPPKSVATLAHLYLALIALNATDIERAQGEFESAVRTDVLVELPPGQSPKAQVLLAEARRHLAAGPPPGSTSPAAPAAVAATTETAPSHLPAYVVGGVGVAALAVGGVFGFLQQQAGNAQHNDPQLAASLNDGQAYAQDGLAADVLFGVGGAALVTAIILFVTEGSAKDPARPPEVTLSAGPRGFALSGAF